MVDTKCLSLLKLWHRDGPMQAIITVNQFVHNDYQQPLYEAERRESYYDFKLSYLIPLLERLNRECKKSLAIESDSARELVSYNFEVLRNEIKRELKDNPNAAFTMQQELNNENYDLVTAVSVENFLDRLDDYYNKRFNALIKKKTFHHRNAKNRETSKSLH